MNLLNPLIYKDQFLNVSKIMSFIIIIIIIIINLFIVQFPRKFNGLYKIKYIKQNIICNPKRIFKMSLNKLLKQKWMKVKQKDKLFIIGLAE